MEPDLFSLYRQILRSRRFEELILEFWEKGEISGEMHLGIGEEAIAAGVVDHLREGDALALDHRGTPPLVVRGVDLALLLKELLGRPAGLCSGRGGHMHLFSPGHLAASSGIVGASAPLASGFALASQLLRPGNVAVAFFGEGAMNQGMVLESFNLAAVWKLPVLFVCKDNAWAITTLSAEVTGGNMAERARSFSLPVFEVNGADVEQVWKAAGEETENARNGDGPAFLLATCYRPHGHFLRDPLLRIIESPGEEMKNRIGPLFRSLASSKSSSLTERSRSLKKILSLVGQKGTEKLDREKDPLVVARRKLKKDAVALKKIEEEVEEEIRKLRRSVGTLPEP